MYLSIFDIVFVIFHVIVTVLTHVHVVQWWIQGERELAPLYMKAWIRHCQLLPFLLCYSFY